MQPKIIVIGTGAAGVAAASKLILNGFKNIEILEAEHHMGGRINTIKLGENVLDIGAQWCHGEVDNVVYEMAKNKNLLSSNGPRYETFQLIRSNGTIVDTHLSDKLALLANSIVEENENEKKSFKGSFGNYFSEKYYAALKTPEYNDIDDELATQFFDLFHKKENSIEASDSWYETSCQNFPEYWYCEGDQLLNWKDRGYCTVFELLQKRIPLNQNSIDLTKYIRFNKKVTKINYKNPSSLGGVAITCSDGSAYFADHVICTVSLGVLKENHLSLFEPQLPIQKINSIEGLSFGTVDKIYVEFPQPFWEDNWDGFSLLWRPDELKAIREDIAFSWLEDVFGFFTVNYQPNILCGWITGPNARRMERMSDAKFKQGIKRLLTLFLKDQTIPEPKNIIRSTWFKNPNFRGSYTYYSMKADALNATTSKLAEPIKDKSGKPIVQFGGEATHQHYYSTVHGAIESGWREAKRLIDFYNIKSQL